MDTLSECQLALGGITLIAFGLASALIYVSITLMRERSTAKSQGQR